MRSAASFRAPRLAGPEVIASTAGVRPGLYNGHELFISNLNVSKHQRTGRSTVLNIRAIFSSKSTHVCLFSVISVDLKDSGNDIPKISI